MHSSNQASQKFWGLLKWKERWGLSWRGWLLLTLLGLASASLLFVNVHPFLAVTRRVDTNNLVVEGWIQRYAFRGAVKEFNSGSYEHIFTTGGPENGSGGYVHDSQTPASGGAEAPKRFRIREGVIKMAPSRVTCRERTYSSALTVPDWFYEPNA